ncbi:MAG: archease, partial [Rhodobacteraceae bacterium]|nr:archease [Paracoccaceae bacterium]
MAIEDVALADLAFEATGESLEDVFRGATQALVESMANPATVPGGWKRMIERRDTDQSALLFDWLSEMVYVERRSRSGLSRSAAHADLGG